jgi:diguanylate cyclase (GGDEF)-like protein
LDPLRESISRFERAGMDSFRLHGLVKLAAALEDMGELAEAEAIYRGVLEDAVDREEAAWLSEVHGTLAGLLHRQGRWEEAREVFHAALTGTVEVERDRDRPYWRRRLADIQSSEGELPEAIETLKAAFDELDRVAQERTEEQVHQALGRLELQRIEHEKEVYRLKNEELGNALAEVESLRGELETRNAELSELVVRDALTGVYNRRWFMSRIATEIDRAARYERPLTIALVDIDLFKSVNDDFGHSAGDAVLVGVSEILNRSTRGSDEVARYGGEEFAVIMPETDGEQGRIVCEKLRRSVQEADWSGAGVPRRVTISCGVAQLRPEDTATSLVDRSDRALYRGKESGRNRVIAES